MEKKTIFILIFCIILAGTLYYFYSNYEPKKEEYYNISISAIENRERIKTGYEINQLNIKGNTSSTYELINLKRGIYNITNRNLDKQSYYENWITYNISENKRIDLILEKPELPKIKKEKDKENIILIISSSNFQDIDFCLIGSINYIFLKVEPRELSFFNLTNGKEYIEVRTDKYSYENYKDYNIVGKSFKKLVEYEEITKENYSDYDICYNGEFSLKNEEKTLNISYTRLSTSEDDDFIKIAIIDKQGNEIIEKIK
jgi:hypothetical protein